VQRTLGMPRHLPPHRIVIAVGVLAVAVAVAGVASAALLLGRPSEPVVAIASPSASTVPTASPTSSPSPSPSPSPSASPSASATPGPDALLGTDGRLTVLLLGSDYRPAHPGNRTDVIMVVSLDPASGKVAAASIPRDTTNFPTGSGSVYRAKVNGLYQSLIGRMGQPKAAAQMKKLVGAAIGVEVDSYAVIGFKGVQKLVDAVGGVDVVLPKAVNDPYYWVTAKEHGVHFPAGRNHLNGSRALILARTRKGDNDFERARRQQLLVAAAVDAVRHRGLTKVPALLSIARHYVKTDLPLASAPELFAIVAKADLSHSQRVVFGPTKWASSTGGTSFALKLGEVRQWTSTWMAPVKD